MYILVGNKIRLKKDIWAGKAKCPHCGEVRDFHFHKLVQTATIFYVPIISVTKKIYVVCDSCGASIEVSRKKYKEDRIKQIELLERGGAPKEIIYNDCNPDNIHFPIQLIKLVVSGLLAGFMMFVDLLAAIDMAKDTGNIFVSIIFSTYMSFMCSIPFIFSLKNFVVALKMRKAYNSLTDIGK